MSKEEEQGREGEVRTSGTAATIPITFPKGNDRRFSKDNHRMEKVLLKVTLSPETIKVINSHI